MSVINQMLRDLDARHASANERAGLPTGLRTLPPEQAPRSKTWLLLAAGLIVGALIAWFFVSQTAVPPAPPAPSPATVAQAPEPQPAPAPASVPAPAPVVAPAIKLPTPVATPPAKPAAAPVSGAAPVEKPMKAVAPPPVVAAPIGEGQIDKQPKSGGLPREQAETEYRKGMQAAGIGDNATAIPALRRALDFDPKHIKARQALLSVLASSRQWDEVKQVAQSGLALDPARTGWASILARLQHEQGDTEGAVKTLESYAAHAAGDADFQGLFAFLLQKRQRYADAAQHYQAALTLRPGEGRWWFGLGLALDAAGRGDEAKAAFGKARDAGNLSTDMLGIVEQKLR
jgi:MSHA biogenesis protein MshN